jgi:hypothetical protein
MSEQAPDLGPPTDARIGDETAELLMDGDTDAVRARLDELTPGTETFETPDELGGTGGEQAGGAG